MATRKSTGRRKTPAVSSRTRPAVAVAAGELREEVQVRRLRARLEKQSLKAAIDAQAAMLATYSAADRGRRNKDWRAPLISADMAIIPDAETLNARARQMVRDTWVAASAVSAFARNVIGCGIIPIPQARGANGELNTKLNKQLVGDFFAWAGDKDFCDVERDQTFWQMQTLAESERATVGESFWVWSYQPNLTPSGRVDKKKPVGFRLQAFEPEQLDPNLTSYTDPATGAVNEVRGGLELDAAGVVVAYHVYRRNPNDYSFKQSLESFRIPRARVLHYYRKTRVRQKRGVTPLASVLQDMRDVIRGKDANLWRMIMEACIGVTVEREIGAGAGSGGGMQTLLPRASGDSGTTPSGVPTVDFVPGMVADPGPGVKLNSFVPQAPGNNYEPFSVLTSRGIAAGAGISYGQLTRDFTRGTYSGQRQEMLEDRKEFEPLQEMAAHNKILPVYRLWVGFMALEGRIDTRGFAEDPARFCCAEYVAPPMPWIDPKNETESIEKLIELKLISREEVAQQYRGMRLSDILEKIAAERDEAEALEITFPENAEQQVQIAEAEAAATTAAAAATTAKAAAATAAKPPPTPPTPTHAENNDDKPQGNAADNPAQAGGKGSSAARMAAVATIADAPPKYRTANAQAGAGGASCATCRFFSDGRCAAYDAEASATSVCDAFEAPPALEDPNLRGGKITGRPPLTAGERSIDDPSGDFLDRGQRGVD